jgi:hypothetical protein
VLPDRIAILSNDPTESPCFSKNTRQNRSISEIPDRIELFFQIPDRSGISPFIILYDMSEIIMNDDLELGADLVRFKV